MFEKCYRVCECIETNAMQSRTHKEFSVSSLAMLLLFLAPLLLSFKGTTAKADAESDAAAVQSDLNGMNFEFLEQYDFISQISRPNALEILN